MTREIRDSSVIPAFPHLPVYVHCLPKSYSAAPQGLGPRYRIDGSDFPLINTHLSQTPTPGILTAEPEWKTNRICLRAKNLRHYFVQFDNAFVSETFPSSVLNIIRGGPSLDPGTQCRPTLAIASKLMGTCFLSDVWTVAGNRDRMEEPVPKVI